jgi:hypothetical protein
MSLMGRLRYDRRGRFWAAPGQFLPLLTGSFQTIQLAARTFCSYLVMEARTVEAFQRL